MSHSPRPVDEFVKHSQSILQKEYVVIGKRRISSVAAWSVIAFFIGITIAIAFLASRSGMLEGSSAARAPRPVWSRWGKCQPLAAGANIPQNTSIIQYRPCSLSQTQLQQGYATQICSKTKNNQCVRFKTTTRFTPLTQGQSLPPDTTTLKYTLTAKRERVNTPGYQQRTCSHCEGLTEQGGGDTSGSGTFKFSLTTGGDKSVVQGSFVSNTVTVQLSSGNSTSTEPVIITVGSETHPLPPAVRLSFPDGQICQTFPCAKIFILQTNSTAIAFTPVGAYPVYASASGGGIGIDAAPFTLTVTSIGGPSPLISSLSPPSAPVGTQVAIMGEGFTPTANTVKFGPGYIKNLSSNGIRTAILFIVPKELDFCLTSVEFCDHAPILVTPGRYEVSVINAYGTSTPVTFTVDPPGSPLTITTGALPDGTVAIPYSARLTATGGVPPYTFGIQSATPLPWVNLNSNTGLLSGTPTKADTFSITARVIDSAVPQASASKILSLMIIGGGTPPPNPWTEVPGSGLTAESPAAFKSKTGTIYLVVRGVDDQVYYLSHNPAISPVIWTSWTKVPGNQLTSSQPALVDDSLGNILLFIRGKDDNRIYTSTNFGAPRAEVNGLTLSGPTAVRQGTNIHLFVRGTDNKIYVNTKDSSGWNGWNEVKGGGFTLSQPTAVASGNGIKVFVRGTDNKIYSTSGSLIGSNFTPSFQPWSVVPPDGAVTGSGPESVVDALGNVLLFIRGLDSKIYTRTVKASGTADKYGGNYVTSHYHPDVCKNPNPYTDKCSCPSGYTPQLLDIFGNASGCTYPAACFDSDEYYCYGDISQQKRFGGWFVTAQSNPSTCKNPNPFTGKCSCGSGYTDKPADVWRDSICAFPKACYDSIWHYCYAGTAPPDRFGGWYVKKCDPDSSGTCDPNAACKNPNPYTDKCSCPSGYSTQPIDVWWIPKLSFNSIHFACWK